MGGMKEKIHRSQKDRLKTAGEIERAIASRALEKRRVPAGAFETMIIRVKNVFPHETLGSGDSDFWIDIEEKATMRPNQAAFQYYLSGYSHLELTTMLLKSFSRYYAGTLTGDISKEAYQRDFEKISNEILQDYPPKYRKKYQK